MGKWLDIKGPVVADTVYADNVLVAKDVAFTLPGMEFVTADVQASPPFWREYTRGRTCSTHTTRQAVKNGTATT